MADEAATLCCPLGSEPRKGAEELRVKGRGARSQTYLVKELVLGQVPDVPRLVHGRKTRGNTESPLVVMDALQVLLLLAGS